MFSDERYKQFMEAIGERAVWIKREMLLQEKINSLREVSEAMREWIDAVPDDTVLPAMPGFDRDWADDIINQSRSKNRKPPGTTTNNI